MITRERTIGWLAAIAGALAFLFLQVVILEVREAAQERTKLAERISVLEAKAAAQGVAIDSIDRRLRARIPQRAEPMPQRRRSY